MRKKSWAYFAGILDGEGCISIHCSQHKHTRNGKYYPHYGLGISIYQQDIRLMKWIICHFGGQYYRDPKKGERKPGYVWHAPTGENGEKFLLALIPHLMLKQEQAKLALKYIRLGRTLDPEKRRILADQCAALNRHAPTTNTPDAELPVKIESDLMGDHESVPVVIQ